MQYVRIFILQSEHVLQNRGRVFVWFLSGVIPLVVFLLFWQGVSLAKHGRIVGWSGTEIVSYYFLFSVLVSFLESHIEEDVSKKDIYEGELVNYLTRPIPYYLKKFLEEFSYRLLQGFFGFVIFISGVVLFSHIFSYSLDPLRFGISILVAVLALLLSFTFKMIIGLVAFWVLDIGGYYQIVQIILLIFAGYIIPLDFLPTMLRQFAVSLPFAYMVYYPALAFLGKLNPLELSHVISVQIVWLVVLAVVYKMIFRAGIKQFTGVGQ